MSDITVPIDGLNDAWMAAQPGDRLFMEPGDHAPVQLASQGQRRARRARLDHWERGADRGDRAWLWAQVPGRA